MDWINTNAILTHQKAASWQDAVRIVGKLLVKENFTQPEYTEAMIKIAGELGPYFVISPGIAMPHARPEFGVLKSGFAAITLKPSVEFGHPDNDPVSCVIAFCAENHDDHIESLRYLAEVIASEDFLNRVLEAITPAEMADLLNGELLKS